MRSQRWIVLLSAWCLIVAACGGSEDPDDGEGGESVEVSNEFVFIETGWDEQPRSFSVSLFKTDGDCGRDRGIPLGRQEGVVSTRGNSFIRTYDPDGNWLSDAGSFNGIVIAAIEPGEWHGALRDPFDAVGALTSPSDGLSEVIPSQIDWEPRGVQEPHDIGLTVSIPTTALAGDWEAVELAAMELLGETLSPLPADREIVWTRWWSDGGGLVAEERITPLDDESCLLEVWSYTAAEFDYLDDIQAAEATFDVGLYEFVAEAWEILNADGDEGEAIGTLSGGGFSAGGGFSSGGTLNISSAAFLFPPIPNPFGGGGRGAAQTLGGAASQSTSVGNSLAGSRYARAAVRGLGVVRVVQGIMFAIQMAKHMATLGEAIQSALLGPSEATGLELGEEADVEQTHASPPTFTEPPDDPPDPCIGDDSEEGVYRIKDHNDETVYVGKTNNFDRRDYEHVIGRIGPDFDMEPMFRSADKLTRCGLEQIVYEAAWGDVPISVAKEAGSMNRRRPLGDNNPSKDRAIELAERHLDECDS